MQYGICPKSAKKLTLAVYANSHLLYFDNEYNDLEAKQI